MLVAGPSYVKTGIAEYFETLKCPVSLFQGFTPNPQSEQVHEGVTRFLAEGCDGLLAVGGGSAIDVAKCIKRSCLLASEGGGQIPLIAIPTTAGSGAESTHNAVIYHKGVKQTITDDKILPDYAILDASVLKTLPVYQKKCSMMDALCQGIESWWSIHSTDESKAYSKACIELISANWKRYIYENDPNASRMVLRAANYSGKAINIAQTTAAHAMSYKLTTLYGLPHGHSVSVCLPYIWEYMTQHPEQVIDPRGPLYLEKVFSEISTTMGASKVDTAISLFRHMMDELGLDYPKTEDVPSDLEVLANSVNPDRLRNSPVRLSNTAIRDLYSMIIRQK